MLYKSDFLREYGWGKMDNIKINGYNNGILIIFKEEASFNDCLEELKFKLTASKKMFGNMTVAIKLEGRVFSENEINRIVSCIKSNTSLNIACVFDSSEENSAHFIDSLADDESDVNAKDIIESEFINVNSIELSETTQKKSRFVKLLENEASSFFVINSDVTDGKIVNESKNIIVLGSVLKGATVSTAGSIYCFGGIYGEAYAGMSIKGVEKNEDAFILCLNAEAEEIKIGNISFNKKELRGGLFKKKTGPYKFMLKDNQVNCEQIRLEF